MTGWRESCCKGGEPPSNHYAMSQPQRGRDVLFKDTDLGVRFLILPLTSWVTLDK